jgi:Fe-S-cluster containining protein
LAEKSETNPADKSLAVNSAMATDQAIWDAIEEIRKQGKTINLFLPDTPDNANIFWKEFKCQRCGCCCQGKGILVVDGILISNEETISLSTILKISKHQFKDKYTITKDGRRLIKYPCPFLNLESKTCTIYTHRPYVCRTYPINATELVNNFDKNLSGKPFLTASSCCPESRRVAFKILKLSSNWAAAINKININIADK